MSGVGNAKVAQPIPAVVGALKLRRRLFVGGTAAEADDEGGGDGTRLIVSEPLGIGVGICIRTDALISTAVRKQTALIQLSNSSVS